MGRSFWIRRFSLVFVLAFIGIAGSQLLQGHTLYYSVAHGLIWATISSLIFTASRLYQSRRGQHCAICKDTPEMQKTER